MPRGANIYDEARLQGRIWTPNELTGVSTSPLEIWFDSEDTRTITTVSGNVSQWNDKSGHARNIAQGTAGSRPVYTQADTGRLGRRVVFDGTADYLSGTFNFMVSGYKAGGSVTIMAVAYAAPANSAYFVSEGSTASNNPVMALATQNSGSANSNLAAIFRDTAGTGTVNPVNSLGATGWDTTQHVLGVTFTQSFVTGWVDGTPGTTPAVADLAGATATTTWGIGAIMRATPSNFLAVNLWELVVLSSADVNLRQKIEGYFAWRWPGILTDRLAKDHPYKNHPPLIGD